MAEVLVEFTDPVVTDDGKSYIARACGALASDGLWQGWIEFEPLAGGDVLRSGRETTQPNHQDAVYWATGLTPVYLDGALNRALKSLGPRAAEMQRPPVYDRPAPDAAAAPAPAESILNPFSVYRKGEGLLRSQLAALSPWHLVNIIRAHELNGEGTQTLLVNDAPALIELIVGAVRDRVHAQRI